MIEQAAYNRSVGGLSPSAPTKFVLGGWLRSSHPLKSRIQTLLGTERWQAPPINKVTATTSYSERGSPAGERPDPLLFLNILG
jgi:hypothetical protein